MLRYVRLGYDTLRYVTLLYRTYIFRMAMHCHLVTRKATLLAGQVISRPVA